MTRRRIDARLGLLALLAASGACAQQPSTQPVPSRGADPPPRVDPKSAPPVEARHDAEAQAQAQRLHEYGLKATFLRNAVRYVMWPSQAFAAPDTPYGVAILGPDPFGQALVGALAEQSVASRRFKIRRFPRWQDLTEQQRAELVRHHVVWVAEATDAEVAALVRAAGEHPTVLVSDRARFVASGGAVAVYLSQDRIGFEIDHEALRQRGVKASADLLKLSKPNPAEVKAPR